jgi:hypothetical protein
MPALEIKKQTGDIFATLERMPANAYLHAHWIGIQNLETMKKGWNTYLSILKEQPCSKLLNCHKELIGPWDIANDWLTTVWAPAATSLGLRYMAHVLAPGIYGQKSFHLLHHRISDMMEIKVFEDVAEAQVWLEGITVTESNVSSTSLSL